MSWHFSQALEAEYLAGNCSAGEPFAPWKSTPTAPDDSCSDKMKGIFHRSQFGTMFAPSTDAPGMVLLTWFLAGFRARTLARQDSAPASPESGLDCGKKWPGSLAKYDRDSRLWKTHQRSLLGGWEEFSETWPRWGSMRDGELLPRETKVPRLSGSDFLLPAPTKSIGTRGRGWGISKTGRARYSQRVIENALSFGYKPPIEILEWSMGWPITWSQRKPLATDKFHAWLRAHGGF